MKLHKITLKLNYTEALAIANSLRTALTVDARYDETANKVLLLSSLEWLKQNYDKIHGHSFVKHNEVRYSFLPSQLEAVIYLVEITDFTTASRLQVLAHEHLREKPQKIVDMSNMLQQNNSF